MKAALDWRSRVVLARNAAVFFRTWHIGLAPPSLEPVVMLLAFGLGLGSSVGVIAWRGQEVSYLSYLAPGLLAAITFTTPFFHALYAAFVRMRYQRTWDGLLTTQVELVHVVWGEILWAGTLAAVFAAIVCAVLGLLFALGLLALNAALLPLMPAIAFIAGCGFAALGLLFTSLIPTIDHMNLPAFLVGFPIAFLSDTYFPVPTGHPAVATLVALNPVHHLAETYRALLLGGPLGHNPVGLAIGVLVLLALCVPWAHRRLRQRVLGE